MSLLRRLEQSIDEKLRELFHSPANTAAGRELIEIERGILHDAVARIETLPRGRLVFPYNSLAVTILLPSEDRRPVFEMVFFEPGALATNLADYLKEHGAEVPQDLTVDVRLSSDASPELAACGFFVTYARTWPEHATPAAGPASRRVTIEILHGAAEQAAYAFEQERIDIGRLADVLDARNRLVRRNDVAFEDSPDPPNPTVSRAHAHIQYDAESARFRVFDDRSAAGTTVVRRGRIIPVPSGSSRGVALEPGDEILLGQARLRYRSGEAET
ncbi:MAG: FHA domain-containing protein [Acidobacteria bacterium]|nr:FHA domain-containing protein [Acidobacteriota bacterium]MBI3278656.1 FHA domain-containing protein [Acidobacteriota bacterium]